VDTVTDTFNQIISGPGGLIKDGEGTMILAAANTYGGSTIVSNGTLRISGGADRLPTGTTLQLGENGSSNSGVFDLNGQNQTVAGLTTGGTGTANQVVNSGSGTPIFTVNYNGVSPQTYAGQLGGSSGNSFAFFKSGTGTLILTGTNTYTGTTTVSAGTLLVNGDHSVATGNVSVSTGATLGGIGTIGGAVTVDAGGAIRGGAPGGTGTLSVANNVTINSTASTNGILRVEASRTGGDGVNGTANASMISLTSGGILNLNPGTGKFTIDLVNGATPLLSGESYTITLATVATPGNIQLNGATAPSTIDPSNYVLQSFAFSSFSNVSLTVSGTNLVLTFTPVPEPATVLGLAAGVLGLGGLVRRRFRRSAQTA
jgi:fibronectin-binding autotransporter adhesin